MSLKLRATLPPEIDTVVNDIYNEIYSLVKTQGKSFSVTDIFHTISATIQAVNAFFKDTDVSTRVDYAVDIVEEVLSDLTTGGVIPTEIGYIVKFFPLKLIVDFVIHFFVHPATPTPAADTVPHQVLKMLSVKCHTGLNEEAKKMLKPNTSD